MKLMRSDLSPARVVHEDDNFITLEVAKNEDVTWHVAPIGDDNIIQRFYMVLFVHKNNRNEMEVWKPWESDEG
jgi:hypothetical protein